MKKLVLGLLAALLMTTGLAGLAGSPATALTKCGKYQTCTKTRLIVKNEQEGKGEVFNITVDAIGTTIKPKGSVTVAVKKAGSSKLVYSKTKTIDGEAKAGFKASALSKGSYVYGVAYTAKNGTSYFDSDDSGTFKIK